MPQLLADLPPPDGGSLLQFIYATAALIVAAYYALNVFNHFKPKPPLHDYVLITEFNARMDGMSKTSKEFRDTMRGEMTDILQRVAKVETMTEGMNQQLFQIENKLDRLIERL